jgi:hypothetical protein
MKTLDSRIEDSLGIVVRRFGSQYVAEFPTETAGPQGFGETPIEAKYSLLLRLVYNAPRHMKRVRELLGVDTEELDVAVDFEPQEDGSSLITIKDAAGRFRVTMNSPPG